MSILGLTLDYGPFGFLDRYDPAHICNHSDVNGRYSYINQPQIAWWNLYRLGEALSELATKEEIMSTLDNFATYFDQYYLAAMGNKLGINNFSFDDLDLLKELLTILQHSGADWTIFWRKLSHITLDNPHIILDYVTDRKELSQWLGKYLARRQQQDLDFDQSKQLMLTSNPAIVLRNHLVHNAIEKAKHKDFTEIERLFNALTTPYIEQEDFIDYYNYPPDWAADISLSYSS